MFVCVCIYVRGGKGGWEEFSEGNEHHYVMHAHAHPQARRFESKSFRNAKQQCPHASASPAPGNRGGRRLLEGVRHCPMFVHAQSLSAVAMSFLFQVGGRGSGKEGGGRTHSNPARSSCIPRALSPERKQPPRSPLAVALPVPLLQASWQSPPPARGKLEGQASVALVFGVAVRCGKEYALRFGNTTAPLLRNRAYICIYLFIFLGRNRVIENPRSLVALVFE